MRRTILLLLVAATGCGFIDRFFNRDELNVLHRNQSRWRALGIVDYSFEFRRTCYCGPESMQPVRIIVRDGSILEVQSTPYDLPLVIGPYDWWPTIDSLFVWSERNLRSGYKLDITYDGAYHFPGKVVGNLPMAIDDEYTNTANKLVRIAP